MELAKMTVEAYIDQLGSNAPAPGGGSASALCGAQGAALVTMVAELTVGKEKYAEFEELCRRAIEEGSKLRQDLVAAIDKDTQAFNLVSVAFKLPKETEEEKAARRQAIADATLTATQVPFETLSLAKAALGVCALLVSKSNPNAASDLGVAALNLLSCAKGAWLNILINLGGVKDEEKAAYFRTQGEQLVAECEALAGRIYTEVAASL